VTNVTIFSQPISWLSCFLFFMSQLVQFPVVPSPSSGQFLSTLLCPDWAVATPSPFNDKLTKWQNTSGDKKATGDKKGSAKRQSIVQYVVAKSSPTYWLTWRQGIAAFINSYPMLNVTCDFVKREYTSSTLIVLQVSLSRDADEEEDKGDVSIVTPYFPKKMTNWWVVVGEQSTWQLLSIKCVTVSKSLNVKLKFRVWRSLLHRHLPSP